MSVEEYKEKLLKALDRQRHMDRSSHYTKEQIELIDKVYGAVIQTVELDWFDYCEMNGGL